MHRALLPIAAGLGLAWLPGCGGEAPPPGAGKAAVITGHASALAGDFDRAAFTCCADPAEQAALDALVALSARMAADDAEGSAAASVALRAAVEAAPGMAALGPPSAAVAAAGELAARREALVGLGAAARALPLSPGGSGRFAWAHCPMKPGSWLQSGEPLANPYYGAGMLRCGNFEPSAPAAPAAPAPAR